MVPIPTYKFTAPLANLHRPFYPLRRVGATPAHGSYPTRCTYILVLPLGSALGPLMVAESTSRARMKRVVAVFTFGFLRASILGQLPPKFDLAFHCKLLSRRPLSPDLPVENEKVK